MAVTSEKKFTSLHSVIGYVADQSVEFFTVYILYLLLYRLHRGKKLDDKKVLIVEIFYKKLTDNFTLIYKKLVEDGYDVHVHIIGVNGGTTFLDKMKVVRNMCRMTKDGANARAIFTDNSFRQFCKVKMRKETNVVEVWHACGAFKKFGRSTADLFFGMTGKALDRTPTYKVYDFVAVAGEKAVGPYAEAMDIGPGRTNEHGQVLPIGVSRTDVFFDQEFVESARDRVRETVPGTKGKKILLYAPTFRGRMDSAQAPRMPDLEMLRKEFEKDWVILIKQHPLVKHRPEVPESCKNFAFDVSDALDIDALLCSADACVTDYSSLIFEYSLFEKPMCFDAYDREEYLDERGFYYPYEDFCPGMIVTDTDGIAAFIRSTEHFDPEPVRRFRSEFMDGCDGHATERIVDLALHGQNRRG